MQALIAATDLEFAELEARAAEATAAADFAEEQALRLDSTTEASLVPWHRSSDS